MKTHTIALAATLAALGATPAQAITFTYSGNTTTAATFDRPFFDFSGLSSDGRNARYQTLPFTVSAAGTYDFVSTASGWDNFLYLYSPTFSAGSPLLNGLVGNDDLGGVIGTAGFTRNLITGVNYWLVTTGYEAVNFGAYTNTINGPGNVSVVPEPAAHALFALGLLTVFAQARRKPKLRESAL
ncbi:MAG: hypothetical protein LH480_09945 [Rubrivivax sp.]|nr:hypothetical protein [Rubrivivax sp.]